MASLIVTVTKQVAFFVPEETILTVEIIAKIPISYLKLSKSNALQ